MKSQLRKTWSVMISIILIISAMSNSVLANTEDISIIGENTEFSDTDVLESGSIDNDGFEININDDVELIDSDYTYFYDSLEGIIYCINPNERKEIIYRSEQKNIYNYFENDEHIFFAENGAIYNIQKETKKVSKLNIEHSVSSFQLINENVILYDTNRDTGLFNEEDVAVFEKDIYVYSLIDESTARIATNIEYYKYIENDIYYIDANDLLHQVSDGVDEAIEDENIIELVKSTDSEISLFAATADDIVSVAESQLGYKESGNNVTKYGSWYGMQDMWCAMFVSWCANQAGIGTDIIPKFASCDVGKDWFKNRSLFKTSPAYGGGSYRPQKGDIIFFSNKYTMSDSTHVGIVTGSSGSTVSTIEGNTSNNDVGRRNYSLSNSYILGYGTPNYVRGNNPEGVIDSCSGGSGSVSVRGWGFDRDDTGTSIPIHVYIGGPAGSSNAEGYAITANVLREDVNNVYGVGNYHGYEAKINTNKTGSQEVYIYACNVGNGENVLLGSRTVNITPRASELKYWLSASDMGSEITECEKGKSYYLCYKMYDTNSGEYFNSYSSLSYTVRLTFYDKNGSEIGYRDFTKVDRGSVQFTTVEAGTCSYKVTISGDLSGEATVSFSIKDTTPKTYKVTYNANGGRNAPVAQTKTENVDLKLSTQKPTRTGYEFFGWGKTSTSNSASYSSGGTYKDNASITLYALWVPVQYIVKYNANGGSGSMDTQLHIYDISKNLRTNTFTRTNYTFKNWNTKADGSGVSYSDGALVKNLSSTKDATFNLYAIWNGISVTGVNLNKTSLSLKVGGTSTLTATVLPSNATNKTVSWKSSNTSVATVSNGVVTAKAVGTATITAVTSDGSKTATCTVTVTSASVAVTSISLNKTSTTLDVGKTETLTATVLPSNATNKTVSWISSNTSVATVSNGVVTAKSAGTATITAKTADGAKTATCTVKVNSPVDENAPKVQVKNVIGKAGNTVDVVLKVENNPGIAVLGFKVGYDSSAMILQSVTVNDVFSSSDITAGDISKNPYTISAMSAAANIKTNGNLVTLTFKIKNNCNNGVYAITLTEPEAYNINEQTVTFTLVNGTVTVKDVEPGDITADGSVNRLDLLRLGKYLADWDVEISEASADVTGDGNVNRLDLLRLGKFLADWDVVLGQ